MPSEQERDFVKLTSEGAVEPGQQRLGAARTRAWGQGVKLETPPTGVYLRLPLFLDCLYHGALDRT